MCPMIDLPSPVLFYCSELLALFFSTSGEPSLNRKDLQALTLVRPTRDNPVLDPIAVIHLNN